MVYLALEKLGVMEAIRVAAQTGCSIWAGSDAVTEEEHKAFVRDGIKLTRFGYPLAKASQEDINDAISTITEHHPKEVIWVQSSESISAS